MLNKKFLLGVILSMTLCLSSCYNDNEEITETTVPTEVTTAAVTDVSSESVSASETTTEFINSSVETDEETETIPQERKFYDMLFPVYENGCYEYMDIDGNIVTDKKFKKALFFSEGLAVVKKNGLCGAIDLSGNLVIPTEFEDMKSFHCGLAAVTDKTGKIGFINTDGELVIPYKYDHAHSFSEDLAVVSDGDSSYSYIIIDNCGNELFSIDSFSIGDFHNGLLRSMYSFYDKSGNCVIPDETVRMGAWESFPSDFSEELAVYPVINDSAWFADNDMDYYQDRSNWEYKYIDSNGNIILDTEFDYAEPFNDGFAVASKDEKDGVIDKNGEFVFITDGSMILEDYSEGYVSFLDKTTPKFGLLDKNGEVVFSANSGMVWKKFSNGLALIGSDGQLMYINTKGEIVRSFDKPYDIWGFISD